MKIFKTYLLLTKPGIILGNLITATTGFILASPEDFLSISFFMIMGGLSCIIASSCIFNNIIDRKSDQKMVRTRQRGLASGKVSVLSALILASLLLLMGLALLSKMRLALILAFLGFFIYVVLYTYSKYYTSHATLIGSFAGALPPIISYCGANGVFDLRAFFFYLLLVFWQMPHFFAIAIYRSKEYALAGIPILPIAKGIFATKVQMCGYIVVFLFSCILLTVYQYAGYLYLMSVGVLGTVWFVLSLKGFTTPNDPLWARKMFQFSLVVIITISIMLCIDHG